MSERMRLSHNMMRLHLSWSVPVPLPVPLPVLFGMHGSFFPQTVVLCSQHTWGAIFRSTSTSGFFCIYNIKEETIVYWLALLDGMMPT